MNDRPAGERITALESENQSHRREVQLRFDQVDKEIRELKADIKEIKESVDNFTNLLNQAKGAKILLAVIALLLGWIAGLGDLVRHLLK